MTPRRLGLVVSILALAVLGPRWARAQGMAALESQPVFQSEGRTPVAFAATCSTATWTLVIASDTISRSTFMESIAANTQPICLSPIAAGATQCVSTSAGPELSPNSELTDYSHAAWYCAASSGTTSQALKGYRTRDKGDFGGIGDPQLQ